MINRNLEEMRLMITIEGIEYKEIEIGTKLEIKPTVITKFSDKSQLSYVWYKYNKEQAVP